MAGGRNFDALPTSLFPATLRLKVVARFLENAPIERALVSFVLRIITPHEVPTWTITMSAGRGTVKGPVSPLKAAQASRGV